MKFKGNYTDEFDIVTKSIGRRKRAEENVDIYNIPYRNDELIIHSGTYKPYVRKMEFVPLDRAKMPLINQWLTGRGKLRTTLDDGGYFMASVIGSLDYEEFLSQIDSFPVEFKVSPFFYLDSGDTELTLTSSATINNPGTIYSQPYIKITGSGDIDLNINSTIYSFLDVDGYIEIDSDLMLVYKDTLNQSTKMPVEFPQLEVGTNAIAWNGTVTKIEIIPKWREL